MNKRYFEAADFALAIGLYHLFIKDLNHVDLGRDLFFIIIVVIMLALLKVLWDGANK